jgi:MFS family permease
MENLPEKPKKRFGNVFYVGLLSFFGGISQDMFVPILPLYLANVLGFSKEFIGLSEGLLTAAASVFRFVAGWLSDKFGKQKPIVFAGYFLSMVSRPLLAFFSGGAAILGLRFMDGVGKGVKDSPKDVLIAGSTEPENRGRGFGIARMLDTFGSVAGPVLLFLFLYLFRDNFLKYHYILVLCALPLFVTLGILIFKVKEVSIAKETGIAGQTEKGGLPVEFYLFLAVIALFTIGNSSDAFLILRAQNVGVGLLAIPLVYALFNFVYASASVPLGSLSDRIGREKVILLGWTAYAIAYIGFALAKTSLEIWIIFAFYGLYYATTEGVAKAFVADIVGPSHRGRAYGVYNMTVGILALPASVIAGFLWDTINPAAPFYFGAILSAVAAGLLFFLVMRRKKIS